MSGGILVMRKTNNGSPIKAIVVNPPTKEQAKKRIKKLSEYLGQTWSKL
jgi:hypothetical protein